MVYALVHFSFAPLASVLNSSNFMLIFIALVVVFFLLGLLLGLTIALRKKISSDMQTPAADNSREKTKQSDDLRQMKQTDDFRQTKQTDDFRQTKQTDVFRQDEGENSDYRNNTVTKKQPANKKRYYDNYW